MKLPKVYEPREYESDIYALWEKSEAFKPSGSGESYSIVVPPPNANGDLHLGHGLTLAIEDIAIRYHRLKGDRTLFVPGADHAGFETWVVYEKQLTKNKKSRFDFTREELYEQVWDFVAENRKNFEQQFRRLGASVDWQHFTFTLDEKIVNRAYATFKKMWTKGLIYRGERLVNFCTFHGTSFADIEVEYKEEAGKLWYIRYPLTDGSGEVVIATTRPETMLGDSGVAVHPDDTRYKGFIGKTVKLPITNREVPIVADTFVDPKFGTGVVKLTPAHDFNDFDVSERHDLPKITVITHEGKMADETPEAYRHLKVQDAREKIVKDLETRGFLAKTEELKHSVGHCYKCGTVIEPLLREQWFIDTQPLAKSAIKALEAGSISFHPRSRQDQLVVYLKNLKDWNISRQIAWGIPIPAFQNIDNLDDWIYDERVSEASIEINGKTYRRDPDVFDTWFSSSSWPYATLDFPDSEDFKDFYPLSLMETGADILYPWVSRMLMFGLYVTGKVPFEAVYLHGLIQDEHGQKMSKSKGNVVAPMQKVDQYGSDAFRIGIISDESPGNNRPYDESKIVGARNFCNKLWNIARFVQDKISDDFKLQKHIVPETLADHWILDELRKASEQIAANLDNYRFSEAYERLYRFVWDDFADWYVEVAKVQLNPEVLAYTLEAVLTLSHPFAPFVTETIWQTLAWEPDSLLITHPWPEVRFTDAEQIKKFNELKAIISEVRYLKTTFKLKATKMHYIAPLFVKNHAALIERLARIKTITEVQLSPGLRLIQTPYQCWLDVDKKILNDYKVELGKKLKSRQTTVNGLKDRLANPAYATHAPAAIVQQSKEQLQAAETALATIAQEYQRFSAQELVKPEAVSAQAERAGTQAPQTPPQPQSPQALQEQKPDSHQ